MEKYRKGRTDVLTALRIEGDGWDVANAVAFLAGDKARWTTGQDLMVDGGYGLLTGFAGASQERGGWRRLAAGVAARGFGWAGWRRSGIRG
jgi:Enoyl-(Acyl carrier protein) reductase